MTQYFDTTVFALHRIAERVKLVLERTVTNDEIALVSMNKCNFMDQL